MSIPAMFFMFFWVLGPLDGELTAALVAAAHRHFECMQKQVIASSGLYPVV